MPRTTPIHIKIAEKLAELIAKGSYSNASQERVYNGVYSQVRSQEAGFYIRQEITIIDIHIYDGLKLNAIKLLIQIQQELEMNNPMWECKEPHKSEVRAGIAQLKQKDILELLTDNLYLINPEKIRRGKPLASLAALHTYCKRKWELDKTWKLSNTDIRRLTAPVQQQIDDRNTTVDAEIVD